MTFLPWNIVESPHVYMQGASSERQFFWMYFFRTALFGEFMYIGTSVVFLSRMTALLGMGCLISMGIGLYQQIRTSDIFSIPLIVCLIIVLESAIAYVILHQSTPNQDFRFSILILPILGYFAVRGAAGHGVMAKILRAWLWSFVIVSITFFSAVVFRNF